MTALVQTFVDIVGIFVTFIQDYLIPATAADITILHVAVWTPVIIGLIGLTVSFLKRMWGGSKKA